MYGITYKKMDMIIDGLDEASFRLSKVTVYDDIPLEFRKKAADLKAMVEELESELNVWKNETWR